MTPTPETPWRDLWSLAWPVALSMLATMSMGLVDMVMLGRLGATALASLSLSVTWWVAVGVLSRNICKGLEPFVSQAVGAKQMNVVRAWLPQGIYASALSAPPYMFLMIFAATGLRLLNQPEELMANVEVYCRILALAVPAELAFQTVRQWLQNQHSVQEALIAIVGANVLNILSNWLLIYHFDFGVVGCAFATLISQYTQLGLLILLSWKQYVRSVFESWEWPNWSQVWQLMTYAIPISGVIAVESWGFVAATVMVGWLGTTALAAHSIGLNIVSTSFMVVLGLSSAAATLVGNAVGAGRAWIPTMLRALCIMMGLQSTFAVLLWFFPQYFAQVFSADQDVIELAVIVLKVGAMFQLFDGIQVMLFSVLRALGDVRVPFWAGLISHWFIGLPMAYWLSEVNSGGIAGVWYGLLIALGCASLLVGIRVFLLSRRPVSLINAVAFKKKQD